MQYQKLNLIQGSPEWKEERLKHLTASQAPVLFGLSPYQTKLQLFDEKMTGEEMAIDDYRLKLFAKGHEAEAQARIWLEQNLKIKFVPSTLVSLAYPDLLASLDGQAETDNLIMEAKYMGKASLDEVKAGKLKPHHLCQVQAQLLVSGAEKCVYFAVDDKGEAAMVDILPDEKYFEEIAREATSFMKMVRDGTPPELTDKDFYIPEKDERFDELRARKVALDLAEKQFNELRSQVLKTYENYKRVRYGDITIIKSYRKGNVDYKKIPQLKGLDLDRFRGKASEVTTVKFEKDKS